MQRVSQLKFSRFQKDSQRQFAPGLLTGIELHKATNLREREREREKPPQTGWELSIISRAIQCLAYDVLWNVLSALLCSASQR